MLPLIETPLWLSVGEVDETVGAVVSIVKELRVIVFPKCPAASRGSDYEELVGG